MAERSDAQAKPALTDYNQAVQEAVSSFDQWIETTQVGVQGISKKAMKFAQRNALSAFDFAQKIFRPRISMKSSGCRPSLSSGRSRF